MRLFSIASDENDDNLGSININNPDDELENTERLNDELSKIIESGENNPSAVTSLKPMINDNFNSFTIPKNSDE